MRGPPPTPFQPAAILGTPPVMWHVIQSTIAVELGTNERSEGVTSPERSEGAEDMEDRHGVSARVVMKLIEEALAGGWDLPEDMNSRIPEMLFTITNDPEESTRNRIQAANALVKIKEQKVQSLSNAAKWAIDLAMGGVSEALSNQPPADGESMIDDRPVGELE